MFRTFFPRFWHFRFFPFSTSGAAWPDRFFSVFHSIFFPFSTQGAPGTLGPWTPLWTRKFFNLSGSIFPHENPTQTYGFWHIWALNVPGQVWPSTARALLDRFFSVFHSVFFPFSVKNALSVFHLKNGKKLKKWKMEKMLSAFSTRTKYIYIYIVRVSPKGFF